MLRSYTCRLAEKANRGKDSQAGLSSQNHLGGCTESKRYCRSLETAWCRCSRESHGQKTARADTTVRRALLECEGSQSRKLNGTSRSYRRQSSARVWQVCSENGRSSADCPIAPV